MGEPVVESNENNEMPLETNPEMDMQVSPEEAKQCVEAIMNDASTFEKAAKVVAEVSGRTMSCAAMKELVAPFRMDSEKELILSAPGVTITDTQNFAALLKEARLLSSAETRVLQARGLS